MAQPSQTPKAYDFKPLIASSGRVGSAEGKSVGASFPERPDRLRVGDTLYIFYASDAPFGIRDFIRMVILVQQGRRKRCAIIQALE
jgi:hypothetical protein